MTQVQYNIICTIISNGAPALAKELIDSITAVLKENSELKAKCSNEEKESK